MTSGNASEASSLNWRLAWLYFGAVMLAYAIVILTARWPPVSVDYPEWVYQGVVFHGTLIGHPVPGYVLKHYPVPFSSTTVGVGLLNVFMGWQLAGKLFICAYLVLAAIATWMLTHALRIGSPLLVVALPTVIFLNLEFWWGRINFEMGMCLVMIFIALLLRGARPVILSAVLVAIYFVHMETCACALLFLGLWAVCTRQWRKLWLAAPTLLLCVWYAIARFRGGNADAASVPPSSFHYGSKLFFLFKANTYLKIFGYVNARTPQGLSQSEAIFGKPVFVVLLALFLCLTVLCYVLIVRGALVRRSSGLKALSAFVLILLPVSLFIPQIFLGSTDPGSRLVLMGAAIGFFLVDWKGRTGKVVAGLCIIFCIANLWQFALLDHSPYRAAHARDLPGVLLTFGHVQPSGTLQYYTHLESRQMDIGISTTSLYLMKNPGTASPSKTSSDSTGCTLPSCPGPTSR